MNDMRKGMLLFILMFILLFLISCSSSEDELAKDKNVLANFAKIAKQAGANVSFKSPANGPVIPFDNGIQMLLQLRGN